MPPSSGSPSQSQSLAHAVYEIGHIIGWLPPWVEGVWECAESNDALAQTFEISAMEAIALFTQVRSAFPESLSRERLGRTLKQAWNDLESAWLGPDHLRLITTLSNSEPEFRSEIIEEFRPTSPFSRASWRNLDRAFHSFVDKLDPSLASWCKLGWAVGTILTPSDSDQFGRALAQVTSVFLELKAQHDILRPIRLDISGKPTRLVSHLGSSTDRVTCQRYAIELFDREIRNALHQPPDQVWITGTKAAAWAETLEQDLSVSQISKLAKKRAFESYKPAHNRLQIEVYSFIRFLLVRNQQGEDPDDPAEIARRIEAVRLMIQARRASR